MIYIIFIRIQATRKTSSSLCLSGVISWYPGHIAKAERELADYIKKVDVVIEVRDARIPFSTTHPKVPEWVGSRPLVRNADIWLLTA